MNKKIIATAMAALCSVSAFAKDTLINADALVDVKSGKLMKNVSVLITDNTIVKVGKQGKVMVPSGTEVLELKGF